MLSHFSCVWVFATLWTIAHQAPLSMGFSRQEYWSGLPCPPAGNLPDPGIEPVSLMSPALAGRFFTSGTTWETHHVTLGKSIHSAEPLVQQLSGLTLRQNWETWINTAVWALSAEELMHLLWGWSRSPYMKLSPGFFKVQPGMPTTSLGPCSSTEDLRSATSVSPECL